jgi:Subtilase family
MNVGDFKNVLVVTACENCFDRTAKIADWANYSTAGLVNIAAPGGTQAEGIPSTATNSAYAVAYGTSQAAAVIGGLAGAMMTCYPSKFQNSRELKVRLQSAVRPPVRDDMARKISAGIVDAEKALKDPSVHHVRVKAQPEKRAKELQWCRDKIDLIDPVTRRPLPGGGINPRFVTQIVRDEAPDGNPAWYVYYEPDDRSNATVKRYGPGLLPDARPLLRVKDEDNSQPSDPISINDVEFILPGIGLRSIVLPPERCR